MILVLTLLYLAAACTSVSVSSSVNRGRNLLNRGQTEDALARFRQAAAANPNFATDFRGFRQGIWTDVGRAHYALGQLVQARQALERAVTQDPNDAIGQIFLGLTSIREGQLNQGYQQAGIGLQRMKSWIGSRERHDSRSGYWDPSGRLNRRLDQLLGEINARDSASQNVVRDLELFVRDFEREINLSQRDELNSLRDRTRR